MQSSRPPCPDSAEGGFLLAGTGVLLLIVIALLGSFSFVANRDSRFKGNYAAGQQIADLAQWAHYFAQTERYPSGPSLNTRDLFPDMTLPDNFQLSGVAGVTFDVEILGADLAPVNTGARHPAASAYLHLSIRAASRAPSDTIALLSGMSARGMTRVGFYEANFPTGDQCDNQNTAVRWGPENTACLNDAQITALDMTDVQAGDIIVPVWETALNRASDEALYRFPQPERPDLNAMATNINLVDGANNHSIANGGRIEADNFQARGQSTIEDMVTRQGATALFDDTTGNTKVKINNRPLTVYEPTGGTALTVQGDATSSPDSIKFTFTSTESMNIAGSLTPASSPGATINLTASNAALTKTLGKPTEDMHIQQRAAGTNKLLMSVTDASTPIESLNVSAASGSVSTGKVTIGGLLNTQSGKLTHPAGHNLGLYTAKIVTAAAGSTIIKPAIAAPPVDWKFGGINQTGNTGTSSLTFSSTTIFRAQDCIGGGCPDNLTSGGGGGF